MNHQKLNRIPLSVDETSTGVKPRNSGFVDFLGRTIGVRKYTGHLTSGTVTWMFGGAHAGNFLRAFLLIRKQTPFIAAL